MLLPGSYRFDDQGTEIPTLRTVALGATGEGGSTHQGGQLAKADGRDPETADEAEPGTLVQFALDGAEEGFAETKGHRTADHRQLEIADRTQRGEGATDEQTRAFDDCLRGPLGWPAGVGLYRRTTAIGLEAALATTRAVASVGFDDHVTYVTGIAQPTLQKAATADYPATDSGAHDDSDEVTLPHRSSTPSFAERDRLGVVVHHRGQSGERFHLCGEWEVAQARDVQG